MTCISQLPQNAQNNWGGLCSFTRLIHHSSDADVSRSLNKLPARSTKPQRPTNWGRSIGCAWRRLARGLVTSSKRPHFPSPLAS
uniref:Uncharacterized protein n=1 Tax=Arundo donax TaxID=35708 RepID=A0A0A8Z839_ARUDO